MADLFVFNRTSPVASTHRAGIRISTNAIDAVGDAVAQYKAAHPVAAGDVLEVVDAGAFQARTAAATITFSTPAGPGTVLPAVGS
jgi:hypothetical protein